MWLRIKARLKRVLDGAPPPGGVDFGDLRRTDPIDPDALRRELFDPAAGGYCAFEGWVRNHNEGQEVLRLEYEGYEPVSGTSASSWPPAPRCQRPS